MKKYEGLYLKQGYIGVGLIAWLVLSIFLTPIPIGISVNGTTLDKPSFFIQFPQDYVNEIGTLTCIFIGIFVLYTFIVELRKKFHS